MKYDSEDIRWYDIALALGAAHDSRAIQVSFQGEYTEHTLTLQGRWVKWQTGPQADDDPVTQGIALNRVAFYLVRAVYLQPNLLPTGDTGPYDHPPHPNRPADEQHT